MSDPAPPYDALRQGLHLDDDGKVCLEVPDDLADLWESIPALTEETTMPAQTSTASAKHSAPVPRLNVLMLVVGSRGDVQPFLVLAAALIKYGHRVRLATHGTFAEFVESKGIEFFNIEGCPVDLMSYMVQNPGLMPKFAAWRKGHVLRNRRIMSDVINASWRACFEPGRLSQRKETRRTKGDDKAHINIPKASEPVPFVADAIIANPPAVAHIHCAEKLGIPLHILFTMPWSPTTQMPHPLANITASPQRQGQLNKLSYYLVESLIWQGLGSIVNDFRYKALQMDPIHPSRGPSLLHSTQIPHTYAWSPSLLPRPADWHDHTQVSGYISLECSEKYSPPDKLGKFLKAGKPPIYVGFGSIVVSDAAKLLDMAIQAAHATGNRVIIATGWSSNERSAVSQAAYAASDTLVLHEDCPHDWLFPQVACVVHHGGAGTTAAGLKAGKPTVVVPFFGDQFFWGERVAQAGVGPPPIPHRKLTVENLAAAIAFALHDQTVGQAVALGDRLRSEDGAAAALASFHSHLPPMGMACRLLPNRAAVWRCKDPNILLSSAAMAVLQRNKLMDPRGLELHRKTEIDVAHGPFEPASGAAWAVTALFLESFRGMGEILAEVGHMPVAAYRVAERIGRRKEGPVFKAPPANGKAPVPVKKRSKWPGEYFLTGSLRIGKAAARAPGEFTAAMAYGAHTLPLAWGDTTVRPSAKVTSVGSGVLEGCKELFWGVADGISGVFVQPVMGLVKEGPVGLARGTASGLLGLPVKFFAAANGIVGYPLKGIDLTLSRALKKPPLAAVEFQVRLQGEYEYARLSEAEKSQVVETWYKVVGEHAGNDDDDAGDLG